MASIGSGHVLEIDCVVRTYGSVRALDGMSFTVRPGSVTGFLGPNGAGKTTAMRAIFGLTALDRGAVRWQGRPIDAETCRRFGYLPEERGLYPTMRVVDQLGYLGQLRGIDKAEARQRAETWLERLGFADRARSNLEDLSLGNQQRIQLISALVHEPDALILDEPFSGLDPIAVDALSKILVSEARRGATVLFSSHQLDLVEHLCEDAVIVDHGRAVAQGPLDELPRARSGACSSTCRMIPTQRGRRSSIPTNSRCSATRRRGAAEHDRRRGRAAGEPSPPSTPLGLPAP